MQVTVPTNDSLIRRGRVTDVTEVAASIYRRAGVTHNQDRGCNDGNKDSSETSAATSVTPEFLSGVTLESLAYWDATPVTPVTSEISNGLHKETGYTRVKIDFSNLGSFIHSEHPEKETNSPNKVGNSELPEQVSTCNPTVIFPSESVSHRHWVVHYPNRLVESVFCPPVSLAELMRLDSNAIAAEPVDDLNAHKEDIRSIANDVFIDPDMHGCDECMNLSSTGVCVSATKLGAMPGYRPVLGRRLDHRCPEWKPP